MENGCAFLAYPLLLPASFRGSSLSGRAIAQTVSTTARRSACCERADRVRAIPNTSVEGRVGGGEVRVREALVLLVVFPRASVCGERANFTRLVLGWMEAKFCKEIVRNTRWKALAEIYTMHSFAPISLL